MKTIEDKIYLKGKIERAVERHNLDYGDVVQTLIEEAAYYHSLDMARQLHDKNKEMLK